MKAGVIITTLNSWELFQRLTFGGFAVYDGRHETFRHRYFPQKSEKNNYKVNLLFVAVKMGGNEL